MLWMLIQEPLRLTVEPWRLTGEPWRLTGEPWTVEVHSWSRGGSQWSRGGSQGSRGPWRLIVGAVEAHSGAVEAHSGAVENHSWSRGGSGWSRVRLTLDPGRVFWLFGTALKRDKKRDPDQHQSESLIQIRNTAWMQWWASQICISNTRKAGSKQKSQYQKCDLNALSPDPSLALLQPGGQV